MIVIILLALVLRFYGINWDQGFHLHPDERMLIMVADRIHFFDQLNPEFFNYGTLPIYLLKGISQILNHFSSTPISTYEGMLYVGRSLSIVFDIGTLILVYQMSLLIFKKKSVAVGALFTYALAFFPIQNTHFFVVDVFLNFFLTATIFCLLLYLKKPRLKVLFAMTALFAAALATKVSAIIFVPYISLILLSKHIVPAIHSFKKHALVLTENVLVSLTIFYFVGFLLYFLFMPYALLSWKSFMTDTVTQMKMSRDPYIFPYTLQYVGTLPYLYFLKNIFLWGMGPILSSLSLLGLLGWIIQFRPAKNSQLKEQLLSWIRSHSLMLIWVGFYLLYFGVIGISAVKFMRYMLPLYPFLAILAGLGFNRLQSLKFGQYIYILAAVLALVWTGLFVNIYSLPHSRIQATDWILKNIPLGSALAVEHWDDLIPLRNSEQYQIITLTLYDQPDDKQKWALMQENLNHADYIILASNRLYVPLPKLADCRTHKLCYPITTGYYKNLFAGKLGFKKIYQSHIYPSLTLFGRTIGIDDQGADESFTVYDHPEIIIFQKERGINSPM